MSIRIMIRRCPHCGHSFSYDPSVGNFGRICPKCGRHQFYVDLHGSDQEKQKH